MAKLRNELLLHYKRSKGHKYVYYIWYDFVIFVRGRVCDLIISVIH